MLLPAPGKISFSICGFWQIADTLRKRMMRGRTIFFINSNCGGLINTIINKLLIRPQRINDWKNSVVVSTDWRNIKESHHQHNKQYSQVGNFHQLTIKSLITIISTTGSCNPNLPTLAYYRYQSFATCYACEFVPLFLQSPASHQSSRWYTPLQPTPVFSIHGY